MATLIPKNPPAADEDTECTPEHCFHAFEALYCHFTDEVPVAPAFADGKFPLFVTWQTKPSRPGRHPHLRGCLGSFEALTLHDGLAEFGLVSAFRDHRFRKIEYSELPSLQCSVNLLTNFEDADSYLDWTIGVHGIQISFSNPAHLAASSSSESSAPSPSSSLSFLPRFSSSPPKQRYSATYLPAVIPEQGWTKIEAIDSAIHKAGWNGRITEDLRRSIHLRRYQSKACTVDWEDYVEWRMNQTGQDIHLP